MGLEAHLRNKKRKRAADDIPTQLAALLGKKKVAQIRKTDENPPRISIITVIATINGKDKNHAAEDLRRISAGHTGVNAICVDSKFPGRGQRDTPVTDEAAARTQRKCTPKLEMVAATKATCKQLKWPQLVLTLMTA